MRQAHLSLAEGNNRAAAYVRMSTEHRQYSTENQLDAIRVYAAAHELEIVRVYTDAGKSGLSLNGATVLPFTNVTLKPANFGAPVRQF